MQHAENGTEWLNGRGSAERGKMRATCVVMRSKPRVQALMRGAARQAGVARTKCKPYELSRTRVTEHGNRSDRQ